MSLFIQNRITYQPDISSLTLQQRNSPQVNLFPTRLKRPSQRELSEELNGYFFSMDTSSLNT
jgi:hypothetical protein